MMLGARTAAWAKAGGGVPTAKSYVQDGLIAMWDGIENAGWGVHSSDHKWVDLIGSSTLKMLNPSDSLFPEAYIWRTDSLYRTTASVVNSQLAGKKVENSVFVEIVFSEDTLVTRGILVSNGGRSACNLMMIRNSPTQMQTIQYEANRDITTDTTTRHSFGINLSTGELYMDGSPYAGSRRNDSWAAQDLMVMFGGSYNTANAEICTIRFYSRVLTSAEIAANYAVDKARFNLT